MTIKTIEELVPILRSYRYNLPEMLDEMVSTRPGVQTLSKLHAYRVMLLEEATTSFDPTEPEQSTFYSLVLREIANRIDI